MQKKIKESYIYLIFLLPRHFDVVRKVGASCYLVVHTLPYGLSIFSAPEFRGQEQCCTPLFVVAIARLR
jgi:hypothetical protein